MLVAFWTFLAIFVAGGVAYAFQAKRPKGSRPRLDIWHRAGLAVSAIWLLVGGLLIRMSDVETAATWMRIDFDSCRQNWEISHPPQSLSPDCGPGAQRVFETFLAGSWGNVLIGALGAIVIAWLCAYIACGVMRWILRGKEASA